MTTTILFFTTRDSEILIYLKETSKLSPLENFLVDRLLSKDVEAKFDTVLCSFFGESFDDDDIDYIEKLGYENREHIENFSTADWEFYDRSKYRFINEFMSKNSCRVCLCFVR